MIALAIEPTVLQTLWFILIAVLWIGYLVLEGFDYGGAMLIPFLGKTDRRSGSSSTPSARSGTATRSGC